MKGPSRHKLFTCLFLVAVFPFCVLATAPAAQETEEVPDYVRAGRIMLFDKQRGVHLHGKITDEGNIMLHDGKGNFMHGKIRQGGKVSIHDGKGNFMHGTLKSDGELRLFRTGGGVFHGRVVWSDKEEDEEQ